MIVLTYRKNIRHIHGKRFKRLSLRQKALLAIQNPTAEQRSMQQQL
jgi:hypothetical protein